MNLKDEFIKEIHFNNENNYSKNNVNIEKMDENIMSVEFSNNENVENIVFNNIGENNITQFISESENIIVEQEVAI